VEINVGATDGVSVVALQGDLDGNTAPAAQARVIPLIKPGCKIVLDMSKVDYMSSAGLRMMLLIFRQVSGQHGKVVLTGLSEEIKDTMSLTGFLDFFTTADTMDAALAEAKG
jgi:anti-sigma B factor antagonist